MPEGMFVGLGDLTKCNPTAVRRALVGLACTKSWEMHARQSVCVDLVCVDLIDQCVGVASMSAEPVQPERDGEDLGSAGVRHDEAADELVDRGASAVAV